MTAKEVLKRKVVMREQNRSSWCFEATKKYRLRVFDWLGCKWRNHDSHKSVVTEFQFGKDDIDVCNETKRGYSAEGCSLLASALRPRLVAEKGENSATDHQSCDKNTDSRVKIVFFTKITQLALVVTAVMLFSSLWLVSSNVSAASITLTIPEGITLDLDASTSEGYFGESSGVIAIKTDNATGYNLVIKSKNNNDLVNGDNKLTSISSPVSNDDFKTSGKVNTWGFKSYKSDEEANTNYQQGPDSEGIVLKKTDKANAGTDNYNLSIAAKIDNSTTPGNYTNTFTITATANKPKATTMQEFTCNLGDDESITLTDTRDNNEYLVAKLKDGKCWMVKNLRISDKTLTPDDSDVASNFTLPASSDSPNSSGSNTSTDVHIDSKNDDPEKDYGGYYTWYGATAGEATEDKINGNTSQSICPKSWRLPTNTEYAALVKDYGGNNTTGSTALHAMPIPGFVYAGEYNRGSARDQEYNGHYLTSTAASSTQYGAYTLYITSSMAFTTYGYTRGNVESVRCVARENVEYNITYNLNSGSWTGTSLQSGSTNAGRVQLNNITPTREGFEFKGWCSASTSDETCTGTTYQPGNYLGLTEGQINEEVLYAIWNKDYCATRGIPASPNASFGGKRWTTTDPKCTWTQAMNACPSGYYLPSQSEFRSLIDYYDSQGNGNLYDAGWLPGYYWSSTEWFIESAYLLYVGSTDASIGDYGAMSTAQVRCVGPQ